MNCKQCRDILLNYDDKEIPLKIKEGIDEHLRECVKCAEFYENNRMLSQAITSLPEIPLNENSIPALHKNIMDSIYREVFKESIQYKQTSFHAHPFRYVTVGVAILLLGFVLGNFLGPSAEKRSGSIPLTQTSFDEMLRNDILTDIRIEQVNPIAGELVISASKKENVIVTGNIGDANIQKILAYALIREQNPGTRLRSVKLIEGVTTSDVVQKALISSVLNDENQGVRLKALRALAQYPLTEELQNTYLKVISNDPSPALRIEAIQIFLQYNNPETRTALLNASEYEPNETIQDLVKRYYYDLGETLEK